MPARPSNTSSSNPAATREASRSKKLKAASARRSYKAKQKKPSRGNAQKGASRSTDENVELLASPWAYKPEFAHIAQVMCETGASVYDLARAFNVDVMTINKWQRVHKEFHHACEIGSTRAIAAVEGALMLRAPGYDYTAVKIIRRKRHTIVHRYKKHVPPNLKAAMFLLVNAAPDEWKMTHRLKPLKAKPEQQVRKESDIATLLEQLKEIHAQNNRR